MYYNTSKSKGYISITCILVSAGKIKRGKNITMDFLVNRKVTENKTQGFHHCEWGVISVWMQIHGEWVNWKVILNYQVTLQVTSKQQLQVSIFIPTLLQHHIQATYQAGPGDGCLSSYELPVMQAENQAIFCLLHLSFFNGLGNNPWEGSRLLILAYQDKSSCWSPTWNIQWALGFMPHLLERSICSSLCRTSTLCCKSLHLWQMISKYSQL